MGVGVAVTAPVFVGVGVAVATGVGAGVAVQAVVLLTMIVYILQPVVWPAGPNETGALAVYDFLHSLKVTGTASLLTRLSPLSVHPDSHEGLAIRVSQAT